MKLPNPFTRALSFLLALVMVLGLCPVHVHAAENDQPIDAAVIFTDLHAMYNGDSSTGDKGYKQTKITNMMNALKNTGLPFSSVHSGGDAFSSNSTQNTNYTDTVTGYIQAVLGDIPVGYVWSDHDRGALDNASSKNKLDKTSHLSYGAGEDGIYGTADDGNYYVYYLSMGDLCSYDRYKAGFNYTQSNNSGRVSAGFTPTVAEAIANFRSDAAKLDKSKPLFIVSHQPLFDNRNDNAWAEDWFDAINAVAEEMDVAFFYGHNHKYDNASDYYYAKGSSMKVATADKWNWDYDIGEGYLPSMDLSSETKTLNFTHMCGGYFDPDTTGSTSSTTRSGTMVVIKIYEDAIQYVTYNKSGVYTGNYSLNETVARDHASSEPELVVSGTSAYFVGQELNITVSLKTGSKVEDVTAAASITGFDMNTVGEQYLSISYNGLTAQYRIQVCRKIFLDAATGISAEVSVPGATGLTVSALGADSTACQTTAGLMSNAVAYDIRLENGTGAAITLPIPAGVYDPAVFYVSDDGKTVIRMDLVREGDTVCFAADKFGSFVIGEDDHIPEAGDVVVGDAKYSFVKAEAGTLADGYYQLQNNHTSKYLTGTKTSGKNRLNLDSDGQEHIWYIKAVSGGYTVQYGGPDGQYLNFSHESASVSTSAQTIQLLNTNGYWGIGATTGNPAAYLAREGTSSSSSSVHGYASSSYKYPGDVGMDWNLYQRVENQITYSVSAPNVSHYLGQNDDQVQLTCELLANGAAGNLPAGGSWTYEIYKDNAGIINAISDNGVITFNKAEGSAYVKIAFTWSEGTAYKYVKVTAEADPNGCDHVYTAETVEATCTQDGYTVYTCHCGETYTEVISATGHKYEAVVTAPTCEEIGYTAYTCACGHSYITDEVAALGHKYESVTTEATCTQDGAIVYTCHCGETYTEVISATGHKYEAVVTAPTCEEIGYTTYTCACGHSYITDEVAALGHDIETVVTAPTCTGEGYTTHTCLRCGEVSVDSVVAALGHDYNTVTTEATCTEAGSIVYTCRCGDTYTEVIPALGHKHEAVVTAPTCEEIGYTTYTCECGDSYIADEAAALGHDYQSVTTEPTCTEPGSVTKTCGRCGHSHTDEIAALGHKYEAVVTAPTCGTAGYTTYTCHCGDSYIADEVPAPGHIYESVTVAATCTEEGSIVFTCSCGDTYTEVIPALGHKHEAVVTAPTCEEIGYTTYTCACGDSYVTDEVAALGHSYEAVVTAPTCEEIGYTTYTCACGDSYVTDEVAALGHKYESVTTEATCTQVGSIVYTCHCGDTYTQVIAALGHDAESVITAPTCEEIGYTTHTCRRCGEVTVDTIVDALGHVWETVTVAATCVDAGSVTETCSRCGESHTEVIPALGHKYEAVVTAPTCEGIGYTTYTCHCGHSYVADEVAALGHKYESVTTEATCTEDGATVYTCACGETYTEVIPALGHKYEAVVTAPTCEEAGYTTYTCACGDSYVTDEVAALGHKHEAVVTAPTCEEAGYTTYTCACGDSYVTDEVAALGHKYESVTTEATCTQDGSIVYTCHCGETYTEVIAALGHKYETVVTAPTCEEAGYTTYTCHCGHSYVVDEVAALGHSYTTLEQNGVLIHTCGNCGHSYTESAAWIAVGSGYVLDTDGIDVGSQHKYIVVGATRDYALTIDGSSVSATAVTIRGNVLIVDDASKMELWFADNGSRESNTYLLTQDGSRGVYHVSSEIKYGHDSKGYWYIGSSSNGQYQLYDYDNCNWFLNYGYAWGTDSVSRFAVSYNTQSVRLFKQTDGYARLSGELIQTVADTDNATVETLLNRIAIQLSANGADVTGSAEVTADMLTWNAEFDGTMAGTYTAEVTYQGVKLGTVTVTVTSKHNYVTTVVAPTCGSQGYTERKCTECGLSHKSDYTAALGHSYTHADADGYRTYTCTRCGHSYSEKLSFTYSQVSALTSGERFVITVKSGNKYYALSHSGNEISAVRVTVSGGKITSEITEDLLWSYDNGKLSYVSGGTTYYLCVTTSSNWWWSSSTLSISSGESDNVSLSNNKLKIDSTYLRYSSSKFSVSSSGSTVYLFREE